jgi:hypothetical protein
MFLCRKKRKPTPSGVVYRTYGIISLPLTGIPVAVAKNEIVHIPGIVFIQLHLPCLLSCFVVCIIAPPSRMCKAFAVRLYEFYVKYLCILPFSVLRLAKRPEARDFPAKVGPSLYIFSLAP